MGVVHQTEDEAALSGAEVIELGPKNATIHQIDEKTFKRFR